MSSSQGGVRGGASGSSEHAMHRVTLKFLSRTSEMAHVRRKSDQLLASFRTCCLVLCLAGLGSFAVHVGAHGLGACTPWDCRAQDPAERIRVESLWAQIPLSLASASLGAVTKIPCLTRRVGPVCWEAVIAALVTLAMTSQLVGSPGYWGRIRGHNSRVEDLETVKLILFIDILLTGSHLALPIRWCMLVPVQVGGVLLVTMASLVLGGTGYWVQFTISLTVLTVLASMGKRSIERHERQEFKSYMAEKTLRVETEFQLDQVRGQGRAPGEDQRSVAGTSVPSTTESARAFALGPGQPPGAEEEGGPGLPAIRRVGLHEQWLVDAGEVRLQPSEALGEGSFGRVIRASYCGTPVAVKLPKVDGRQPPRSILIQLCNELRILRRLRHPNVVFLHGALLDSGCGFLALVLELVDGVSLRVFISPRSAGQGAPAAASAAASAPADVDRVTVLADISSALWYLHTRQPVIVHGDLKDSNVFVETGGLRERPCRAKLLDFGLSRAITKHARPLGGTLLWMAPEVIRREGPALSTAADVFSFGRLAFFVVTGVHPATLMTRSSIFDLAQRGQLPQMRWPRERARFAQNFRGIVEGCDTVDPAVRPRIAEVHPVFSAWLGSAGLRCVGGAGAGQGPAEGPQEEAAAAAAEGPDGGPEEGEEGGGGARPTDDLCYVMDPRFELTTQDAKAAMLTDVMMRCNIKVSQTHCCHYHALALEFMTLCAVLQRVPCGAVEPSRAVGQCGTCRALVLADDVTGRGDTPAVCFRCGEQVAVSAVS